VWVSRLASTYPGRGAEEKTVPLERACVAGQWQARARGGTCNASVKLTSHGMTPRPGAVRSRRMFLWCASLVPPPISSSFESRHSRSTWYSPT